QGGAHIGMLGSEDLFPDGQNPLPWRTGGRQIPTAEEDVAEGVGTARGLETVRSELRLGNLQAASGQNQRLFLAGLAASPERWHQNVKDLPRLARFRAGAGLDLRQELARTRLALGVAAFQVQV